MNSLHFVYAHNPSFFKPHLILFAARRQDDGNERAEQRMSQSGEGNALIKDGREGPPPTGITRSPRTAAEEAESS